MFYFFIKKGLNVDLKRHAKKEAQLRQLIKESDGVYKSTFEYLLKKLLDSKVHLVDQIGRKP
jgi:hypothetical protein